MVQGYYLLTGDFFWFGIFLSPTMTFTTLIYTPIYATTIIAFSVIIGDQETVFVMLVGTSAIVYGFYLFQSSSVQRFFM